MEILAHGKTFAVATCEHCGCKFGFCKGDVYEFMSPNGEKKQSWISCPECNKSLILREVEK